ncbi:MAG: hypothetical protein PHO30_03585, partial [Candidatus Omnitrophica bacterium]|nr:hypothetical protein [Candidatus Omnitrophota bacterium]
MFLLKSRVHDLKIIGYYLGKIVVALGLSMGIPLVLSLTLGEYGVVCDFIIGIAVSLVLGN